MNPNDARILIALDLIARKVDSLPLSYMQLKQQLKADDEKDSRGANVTLRGFDAMLANTANRAAVDNWPKLVSTLNSVLAAIQEGNSKSGRSGSGGSKGGSKADATPHGPISPDQMREAIFAASPLVKAQLASTKMEETDPNKQREAIFKDKAMQKMGMTADTLKKMPDALVAQMFAALPADSKGSKPDLSAKGLEQLSTQQIATLHAQLPKPKAPPAAEPMDLPSSTWDRPRKRSWKQRAGSGLRSLRKFFAPKSGVRQRQDANRETRRAASKVAAKAARSPAASAASKVASPIVSAISKLGAPILLLLTPLALLASVVNSTASGFGVVISASKLLAATLAPLLLPIMFTLAVGLANMSDMLWAKIMPALDKWFALIIGPGLQAMAELVDATKDVIEVFELLGQIQRGDISKVAAGGEAAGNGQSTGEALAGAFQFAMKSLPGAKQLLGFAEEQTGMSFKQAVGGLINGKDGNEKNESAAQMRARLSGEVRADMNRGQSVTDNKLAVLKELQLSMGGRGSIGSVAGINRSAQQAAFGMSPFEMKMLERMQVEIDKLTQLVINTSHRPEGRYSP